MFATADTLPDLSLFDESGRCLPKGLNAPAHARSRRYFRLQPPRLDMPNLHARLRQHLGAGQGISTQDFCTRVDALRANLQADPHLAAITRGIGIPFILPRLEHPDVGTVLDKRYLPAIASAFGQRFPDYRFTSHHTRPLAGLLGVLEGSRHERLIEASQEREVVGLYFPCLSEYSVPAALEQVARLPDNFVLAGGYDTSAALVACPELLLRTDGYPPLLWLSALAENGKPGIGYHYEAYGYNLTFNRRPPLGMAAEYWSHGLSVLETV